MAKQKKHLILFFIKNIFEIENSFSPIYIWLNYYLLKIVSDKN